MHPTPTPLRDRRTGPRRVARGALALLLTATVFVLASRSTAPPGPIASTTPTPHGEPIASSAEAPAAEAPSRAAADPAPAWTATGLWGSVVAAVDGRPIGGAAVTLAVCPGRDLPRMPAALQRRLGTTLTTRSDPGGRFAFPEAPVGLHRLRVVVDGFGPHEQDVRGTDCGLVVALRPGAAIAGRVRSAIDGTPLDDVRIALLPTATAADDEAFALVRSAADGSFFAAALPATTVWLRAERRGWIEELQQDLALQAGAVLQFDLSMRPGRTVSGTVRQAATGLPLADATITTDWTDRGAVHSDAAGRFELHGVGPGAALTARAARHAAQTLAVPDGERPTVDFALPAGATLTGRLLPPDRAPRAGLIVLAVGAARTSSGRADSDLHSAPTDDDGFFRLDDLGPGRDYQLLCQGGTGARLFAAPRRLGAGEQFDLGDLVLPAAASLGGQIVDTTGRPLADEPLDLQGGQLEELAGGAATDRRVHYLLAHRRTRTSAAGLFAFEGLPAGRWQLFGSVSGAAGREPIATLDLAPGESRRDLSLTIVPPLPIAGRLHGQGATDVSGFELIAVDAAGDTAYATVRADGSFEFPPLRRGSYRLLAVEPRHGLDIVPHCAEAGDRSVALRAETSAVISGIVYAKDTPARGITVWFTPAGPQSCRMARTDDEGRFCLQVAPGSSGPLLAVDPVDPAREASLADVAAGREGLLLYLR